MLTELATFRETVLDNARLRTTDSVADIGAGTGLLTLGAADRAPEGDIFAIDVSVDALEELRRVSAAPNVFFLIGSADVLPLPNGSLDVIVTRSVLIYVRDKSEAAREFFRTLRPGGRLSIFEPINRRNTRLADVVDFGELNDRVTEWERARYGDPDDPMLNFDEQDLEQAFNDAGFTDIRTDLRSAEHEIAPERMLNVVGAPGRLSLLAAWAKDFPPQAVEQLAAAVRAAGPIRRAWPAVYLTALKS
jgi:ubiquinone/menaquinone biosynthesis C-methylase UbiE